MKIRFFPSNEYRCQQAMKGIEVPYMVEVNLDNLKELPTSERKILFSEGSLLGEALTFWPPHYSEPLGGAAKYHPPTHTLKGLIKYLRALKKQRAEAQNGKSPNTLKP